MQKVWLWTMLVILMAALFAGGLILGLGTNAPEVTALRTETEEQQQELTSMQSRLSNQDQQLASLNTQIGDVNAERSGLSVSLEASRSTASDLEVDRATLSNELNNVQTQLVRAETSLASTEERAHNLQVRVLGLQESQRDLTAAVGLLSELEELNNSQYWPNRGDALLWLKRGTEPPTKTTLRRPPSSSASPAGPSTLPRQTWRSSQTRAKSLPTWSRTTRIRSLLTATGVPGPPSLPWKRRPGRTKPLTNSTGSSASGLTRRSQPAATVLDGGNSRTWPRTSLN